MSKRTIGSVLIFTGLLGLCVLLSGCGPGDDSSQTSSPPASSGPSVRPPRTEFMPPDSPESMRRHIYGGKDGQTEVEIDVTFRDGRSGYLYYREDRSLKESKEIYPDHQTVKQDILYAADGKTAQQTKSFRQDGTLSRQIDILSDGSKKTSKIYPDGKAARSVELASADGTTVDTTWYRQDGVTFWAKFHSVSQTVVHSEFYGTDGKLLYVKEPTSDSGFSILVLRPDGTVDYKQNWTPDTSTAWYKRYVLGSVEEFAADGKTHTRKLVASSDGKYIEFAYGYDASDTQVSKRFLDQDEKVQKEEQLDKTGKVVKTEKPVKPVTETIDPARLNQPNLDDPSSRYWRD